MLLRQVTKSSSSVKLFLLHPLALSLTPPQWWVCSSCEGLAPASLGALGSARSDPSSAHPLWPKALCSVGGSTRLGTPANRVCVCVQEVGQLLKVEWVNISFSSSFVCSTGVCSVSVLCSWFCLGHVLEEMLRSGDTSTTIPGSLRCSNDVSM